MNKLTPTFADLHKAQTNGAGSNPQLMHVMPAHEPTSAGEQPPIVVTNLVTDQNSASGFAIAPAPAPAPLKVALIGTAPSSRMLAPFNDPSWKIWACSPGNMNTLPRVDLWFELHSNLLWPECESYGKPYIEWLKQQKFPIYMQDRWPTAEGNMVPLQQIVPNATGFPMNEMVAEFGDSFFTSSFAWMMALAIMQGATEISLYGIDMASRDEYILQRPGFFFFRYQAEKRGIKVSAPHESDIMQSPALYAYVDSTPFGRKIAARRQEVKGRVSGMVQQRDQLSNSITYLQGAQEDLDYFESIWSGVCNKMGRVEYENSQIKAENAALKAKIAELMAPKMTFEPMNMTIGTGGSGAGAMPETPPLVVTRKRRRKSEPQSEQPAS
jgi:hypothetical protein